MSFTSDIKNEIYSRENTARHCQLAELAAIFICCAKKDESGRIVFDAENLMLTERIVNLLNKTYGPETAEKVENSIYISEKSLSSVLNSIKFNPDTDITDPQEISGILLKNSCCRRAALTAMFLCLGSITDPEKNYHCEYVCVSDRQAAQLIRLLKDFDIKAHRMVRKGRVVVYIKESECIAELLNVIGAHRALMHLENLRIEREVRNDVNRAVNCDAANAKKLAAAAGRQIEDIEYLRDNVGLDCLPENLSVMAHIRIENPDLPLKELGELLDPPIGKSGVNHRLRKLSELAEEYRNKLKLHHTGF